HFIVRLSHQKAGVTRIVLRLQLISRERRVDGLRGIEDAVEELSAGVFLTDAAEIRTEVAAAVADPVAQETLHAAFGDEDLLAARSFGEELFPAQSALKRLRLASSIFRAEASSVSFVEALLGICWIQS